MTESDSASGTGGSDQQVHTRWLDVALLFVAGCTSAFHIGKIPAALPQLTSELQLTLLASAWLVSLFSILSALSGLLVSLVAANVPRLAALGGFIIAGVASIVGAVSGTPSVLLISRAFEGFGWILIAITIPVLLAAVCSARDKPLVMGIWGAFLPVGMATSLAVAPVVLASADWRMLWLLTGGCSLLAGLVVWFIASAPTGGPARRWHLPEIVATVWRPIPVLMFVCFLAYSAQFLALFSFLPTLLLERFAIGLTLSAQLVALAIACNVIGNVLAGWWLRAGVSAATLLALAMAGFGFFASLVFSGLLSMTATVAAAMGFAATGGVIPGTLFALAQQVVSRPALAAIILGVITQAAGIGQLLGPPALAAIVERGGSWASAMIFSLLVCTVGAICALLLNRAGLDSRIS